METPRFRDIIISKFIYVTLINIIFISSCASIDIIRETKYGTVRGFMSLTSQKFLGIPYAAPPRRWEAPRRLTPWYGILDATQVKPKCYQPENCASINARVSCRLGVSEDCLYLNIYAPLATTERSRKAVMLYIHGGYFEVESGGSDAYNGEAISSKGHVIVVTFNYRLGAFGFLVTGDRSNDITGNYGILDQIQALRWVYENIGDFGGDNSRITLFGQSAGALSIGIHMASKSIAHLFHRVIIQSSPFTVPLKPQHVAVSQGEQFALLLNCSARNVACLRSKSASAIAAAQGIYSQQAMFPDSELRKALPWIPHIDGTFIYSGVTEAFGSGSFVPKPAIIGTTEDEGVLFTYQEFREPMSALEYQRVLFSIIPTLSSRVYQVYRPTNTFDARPSFAEFSTDFTFYCSARAVARSISRFAPVYTYVFNDSISMPAFRNQLNYCTGKACHGVELPYVFQSAPGLFTNEEFRLSDSMIHYWTNFAKTGNPNKFELYSVLGHSAVPQIWLPYIWRGYNPELTLNLNERRNYLTQGYKYDKCQLLDQGMYKAR